MKLKIQNLERKDDFKLLFVCLSETGLAMELWLARNSLKPRLALSYLPLLLPFRY